MPLRKFIFNNWYKKFSALHEQKLIAIIAQEKIHQMNYRLGHHGHHFKT
jgi:hypothetical protein